MDELPNNVIVLVPTVRMLDWINESEDEPLEMHELLQDNTAVVVPELETNKDLDRFLREHWRVLFEAELESWATKDSWPEALTYKLFREFLEVRRCCMVYFLGLQDDQSSPPFALN